jgi:hypothetical protein
MTMPFYGALSTVGIENEDIFAKFVTAENGRKTSNPKAYTSDDSKNNGVAKMEKAM